MNFVLFAASSSCLLWLLAVAIISRRPRARLARGVLASTAVVAGSWAHTASAGLSEVGEVSLVLSVLRLLA